MLQTEEFSFPPPTSSFLTEGDIFLSGGTTLKGFGKAAGIPAATWASGGNLNQAKILGNKALEVGTTNRALTYGGYKESPTTFMIKQKQYNGTSWTELK